jgi:putrescine transport system substrate-binding protein
MKVTKHLLAAAMAGTFLLGGLAASAFAQGIIPGKTQPADLTGTALYKLSDLRPQDIATVQRLLMRLGYLRDDNLSRTLDTATISAISSHLQDSGWLGPVGPTPDQLLRSLFGTIWKKEGWADGRGPGQQDIVEKADVRLAQDALKKLNTVPGPTDGVFGPATLAAVEGFQADSGMKVTGLLTRNTFDNIMRAQKFAETPPASTVRVLSAPGTIDPAALEKFETDTRIRVVNENFESSGDTKKLLMEGSSDYDLMIQAGAELRQVLEKKDAVIKLDRLKMPNSQRLDTASQVYTEAMDPLNAHSIPYQWGTVGLGFDKAKVLQLMPNAPVNSMALLLDPRYATQLASCGIAVVDEPIDIIPSIVSYLGGDFRDVGITDLEAVDAALDKVGPFLQVVSRDAYVDGLASGRYCAGVGFSGDALTARERGRASRNADIAYVVPKEGSELWFQMFVLPQNGKNQEGAYKLVDYLLTPEVAATATKNLLYANTVYGSGPLLEARLLEDPGLYPPREVMGRLAVQPPLSADVEAELTRIWSKLKRG